MSEGIIWFRIKSELQFHLVNFMLTFFIPGLTLYYTILEVYLHFLMSNTSCYKLYDKIQNVKNCM